MEYLAYIFVIVGIVLMIISMFMRDKDKQKENRDALSPQEREQLLSEEKKELDGMLKNRAEDAIEKADEQLSRLSNEKIISVSEYSDQVLEKINQNHQEVVFLYNMLNEKEEEMKKMMTQMKTPVPEETSEEKQRQKLAEERKKQPEKPKPAPLLRPSRPLHTEPAPFPASPVQEGEDMEMLKGLIYAENHVPNTETDSADLQENVNVQEQVLSMYAEGMSVLEISQSLNRGQGEVKLIIELYRKKHGITTES